MKGEVGGGKSRDAPIAANLPRFAGLIYEQEIALGGG